MFSFKSVLIRIFSPPPQGSQSLGKDNSILEKKIKTLPNFCFLKFYAVASVLTMKEHYEETTSHFGQVCFYMTMIFF